MEKSNLKTFLLILPQLSISFVLVLGVVYGLIQSLGYIPALGLEELSLKYYIETISDPNTLRSLFFSLWISFVSASVSVLIGLVVCYFFVNQENLPIWVQRIIQIPIIIPHIIVALFVIQFFSRTGIIARLLYFLGIENAQNIVSPLLFDKEGNGVILGYLWKEIPFVIFFSFTLIRQINSSLGKAAQSLGASRIQAYIYVILPLCKKTIWIVYFIIFLFAFGAYELPSLLGPTLPQSLPEATYNQYIHPDLQNRPYAMAMNGWIFIFSLAIAIIISLFANMDKINPIKKSRREANEEYEI